MWLSFSPRQNITVIGNVILSESDTSNTRLEYDKCWISIRVVWLTGCYYSVGGSVGFMCSVLCVVVTCGKRVSHVTCPNGEFGNVEESTSLVVVFSILFGGGGRGVLLIMREPDEQVSLSSTQKNSLRTPRPSTTSSTIKKNEKRNGLRYNLSYLFDQDNSLRIIRDLTRRINRSRLEIQTKSDLD